jgi:hypothetical protein
MYAELPAPAKLNETTKQFITILYFVIITSLVSISIILYFNKKEIYNYLFLLPVSYMIFAPVFYFILFKFNVYHYGPIFKFANIVIFIRYIITPLAAVYTQYHKGWGIQGNEGWGPDPSPDSMNYAVFLMMVELFFGFFIILISVIGCQKKEMKREEALKNKKSDILFFENRFVIVIFLALSLMFLLAVSPQVLLNKEFLVLSQNFQKSAISFKFDGLVTLLVKVFKTTLMLLAYSIFYQRYLKKESSINILLSFLILTLFLGWNVSPSRWNVLFLFLSSFTILRMLYPRIPKVYGWSMVALLLISVVSISLYKFNWLIKGSENPVLDIIGIAFGQCQDYFSGPRVVGQCIDMKEILGNRITFSTMVNDIFGNFPGLADSINQQNRINAYFNYYNYGNFYHDTLIMPMIGIGYCVFPLFPSIFTIICLFFVVKIDYASVSTTLMEFKYAYLYFGFYLAMCMGFSIQIVIGHIYSVFLPFILLYYLNRKISVSRYW